MDRAELARVNRFAAVESLIVLVSHAAVKRLKMIVQRRQRHRHHACGRSAPCSQLTLRTLLARSLSPTAQQSRSQAVSIPRIFFFGGGAGNPPPKKTYNSAPFPKQLPNCVLNHFLGWNSELQVCRGNFLLMDNKHRKLFVIQQSKRVQIYA